MQFSAKIMPNTRLVPPPPGIDVPWEILDEPLLFNQHLVVAGYVTMLMLVTKATGLGWRQNYAGLTEVPTNIPSNVTCHIG